MTIIRVDKSAGRWEAIPVALINDASLSLDARGFAAWLMTRGDNWKVRAEALPRLLDIGRDRARRLIRELESSGYLVRNRTREHDGRWVWTSTFTPTPAAPTVDGFPVDGQPVDGQPTGGEPADGPPVVGRSTDGKPVGKNKTRASTRPKTTTTTPVQPSDEIGDEGLRIPAVLNSDYHDSSVALLRQCPAELRQLVLDEIAGLHDRLAIRGNPVALLASLVSRAAVGTFVPAAGVALKRKCDKREAQRRQAEVERSPPTPETAEQREAIQQRLRDLRASLMQAKTQSAGDSRVAHNDDVKQVFSTPTERKTA